MGKFSSKRETIKRPPSDTLEAADFIARGGIGGVPTETVYGLAADATNPDAVRKIFEAKGRPFIDPLIVHVCDMDMRAKSPNSRPKPKGSPPSSGRALSRWCSKRRPSYPP